MRSPKCKDAKNTVRKKAGAPSKYKPEYNDQVVKLCKLGATDKEMADFFNVTEVTLNNWKNEYPDFFNSIKEGRLVADMEIANSLYNRAKGYEQEVVKVFQFQGEPIIVPIIEKVAPDTGAAMAWLKNRRSRDWRDKRDVELSGSVELTFEDQLSELVKDGEE